MWLICMRSHCWMYLGTFGTLNIVHTKCTIAQLAMEPFPVRNGSKTAQLELVGELHISVHLSVCGKRMVATWLVPPAASCCNSDKSDARRVWGLAQLTLLLATDNWASNLKACMPECAFPSPLLLHQLRYCARFHSIRGLSLSFSGHACSLALPLGIAGAGWCFKLALWHRVGTRNVQQTICLPLL